MGEGGVERAKGRLLGSQGRRGSLGNGRGVAARGHGASGARRGREQRKGTGGGREGGLEKGFKMTGPIDTPAAWRAAQLVRLAEQL